MADTDTSADSVGSERARFATDHDLERIGQIAATISATMVDQRGGSLFLRRESGGDALERATSLLNDPNGHVVVGTYDDVVFGYAIGVVETLRDGGLLGRIDDLAVLSDARESGIGEAMMNLLVETFRSANCFGVDSRALPGDRQTKNFFESFGLKARMLTVHRSLSDD